MISASQHSPTHAPAERDVPPPDPRGELQLFLDHLKAGRKQEANALLARILASDPNQLAPYALLVGGLLAKNSQFQEAVPLYQEAIRVSPGDPAAYFYLGVTHHALKDYESCDRTWDHLAARFPQHYLSSAAGAPCSEAERSSGCDGLPRGHSGRRPWKSDAR